jgi:hypothetical protein
MFGKPITCPACKKPITIVTARVVQAYGVLELGTVALLDEVRQAHRERIKLWDQDQFPNDPRQQQIAAQKTKELNEALASITGYFMGKPAEPPPTPKPPPEKAPAEKPPQRPPPEPNRAPKAAQPEFLNPKTRVLILRILIGLGVTLFIALLAGGTIAFLQRRGAPLTNESTVAQWAKANEFHKRDFCHAVLVQMSQDGILQKFRVRLNDDVIYDSIEALSRQQKPEDLDRRLVDLCTKLVENVSRGKMPSLINN